MPPVCAMRIPVDGKWKMVDGKVLCLAPRAEAAALYHLPLTVYHLAGTSTASEGQRYFTMPASAP